MVGLTADRAGSAEPGCERISPQHYGEMEGSPVKAKRAQPYCLRYWGPDKDGLKDKGQSSYKNPDTALMNARRAVESRLTRCPASHVTVTNEDTGEVLFTWHGPEAEMPA